MPRNQSCKGGVLKLQEEGAYKCIGPLEIRLDMFKEQKDIY